MSGVDILSKLFGSSSRVKVMRLFLLNQEAVFEAKEVVKRTKVPPETVRSELGSLVAIRFVTKNKKGQHQLNPTFPLLNHLRGLLQSNLVNKQSDISDRFAHCGKIKFLLVAGIFIHNADSRADLVIVGDQLKRGLIERSIKALEAEIGRELVYAVFETKDFNYRLNACDKFIRDVLDYPHERIIDKLAV